MVRSTILIGEPDNIDAIHERFPEVKNITHVVFTYAPHIYKRIELDLPPDLRVHEATHLQQQGEDPAAWWDQYLNDTEFRYQQELEAYGYQMAFVKMFYSGRHYEVMKNHTARSFSSSMYDLGINQSVAESKIRNYAKSVDRFALEAALERITDEGEA